MGTLAQVLKNPSLLLLCHSSAVQDYLIPEL